MDSKFWQRSATWRTAYALELISLNKMDSVINSRKWVKYEDMMGIKSVGNMAREVRLIEQEKMRKNWRLAQERGKRKISPKRPMSLKRDTSAELLMDIINPTPVERIPPGRFMKASQL